MGQPALERATEDLAERHAGEIGVRTRLVREALDQLLTPRVRERVMIDAGWSDRRDGPVDPSIGLRQWVDTQLFPRLVDKTALTYADELRRHVRELIAKTEPRPARPPASSAVRARVVVADPPTRIPCAPASSVLVWSARPDVKDRLAPLLGRGVQLAAVSDAAELAATLTVLRGRISLVLMDRCDRDPAELRALDPRDLRGHQVIVWGPAPPDDLSYGRLFEGCERAVGCSDEAAVCDVAGLTTALLGVT